MQVLVIGGGGREHALAHVLMHIITSTLRHPYARVRADIPTH